MAVTAPSITQNGTQEPFDLQVGRDQISWHKKIFQFGLNLTVGTTFETIWTGSSVYAYLAAATVLKISSGSANDTAAGTGARTITISGLDADYNQISETVSLNGQTAVNTVNSYLRVFDMNVATAGSGGTAAGIIYAGTGAVTSGVPAVVYGQIDLTYNTSAMALFTVPAGYTAYITSYTFTSASAAASIVTGGMFIRPLGGVFNLEASAKLAGGNSFDRHFDIPLMVAEKSDIEMQAAATTTAQVTGEMHIIYIKNDAAT